MKNLQYFNNALFTCIHAFHWLHCSLHSFLEIRTVIIVIKRKECDLRHPYRTRARARVMSEEEDKVKERIKADIEALKEKMATMMKAMMSMKKIMEVNAAAVAATSVVSEVDPAPPSGLNQINHPISDMVGQRGKELGSTGSPHFVQVQNKHAFPPYCLPPNYTPPNVAHTPNENVNDSTSILIESQQPQSNHAPIPQPMGGTHEIPHHNLANFEPGLEYATEGKEVDGVPLPNTLEGP